MARGVVSETLPHVDWLERDRNIIEGLDHLGVQAVSVNLYALLLPGVTNVTDRARYYSFYLWVLHRFAQSGTARRGRADWLHWLRKVEFSYATASVAHEISSRKFASRVTAVVGSDTARRLLCNSDKADVVDIQSAALLDESGKVPKKGAYFKNPEGGFRQYYKVPLEILGLLAKDPEHRYPDCKLTSYAGVPVTESIDSQTIFHELIEFASSGSVRSSELATLGSRLNPSAIEPGNKEEDLLRRLFLGKDDELCQGQQRETREWRRASILLALQCVHDNEFLAPNAFDDEFRWACTALALVNGTPWKLPDVLKPVAAAWAAYHRNDLMNYALESLFWVVLRKIGEGIFTPRQLAHHIAEMTCGEIEASSDHPRLPALSGHVSDWIAFCERTEKESKEDPWGQTSTWKWSDMLQAAIEEEDDAAVASWSVRLLGRLASDHRRLYDHPFGTLPNAAEIAAVHEVHLGGWLGRTMSRAFEPLKAFIEELVLEWIIYRHLRVATRKLAAQGVSTFKFRPELGSLLLLVEPHPVPTFTNPRLRQLHRILGDLHYLTIDAEGTRTSPEGANLIVGVQ